MDAIETRSAKPDDADAVADYHARCFAKTYAAELLTGAVTPPDRDGMRRQLREWFSARVVPGLPENRARFLEAAFRFIPHRAAAIRRWPNGGDNGPDDESPRGSLLGKFGEFLVAGIDQSVLGIRVTFGRAMAVFATVARQMHCRLLALESQVTRLERKVFLWVPARHVATQALGVVMTGRI